MKCFHKIAVFVLAICLLPFGSYADIAVNIKDSFGIKDSGGSFLAAGALYQLIWSLDNVYSGVGGSFEPLTAEAASGDYSAYGDYVLTSGFTPSLGGWGSDLDGAASYTDAMVGGNNINTGYLFLYVFQDGTPNDGDYFGRTSIYDTSLFADSSILPAPPEDPIDIAPSSTLLLDTYQLQVPEPSTMALMGLGLVFAGLARKRRKSAE